MSHQNECDTDKGQGWTKVKVPCLFSQEDQVNQVKLKLMKKNILWTFSAKKVCDKLLYRRDAQQCQLPAEKNQNCTALDTKCDRDKAIH